MKYFIFLFSFFFFSFISLAQNEDNAIRYVRINIHFMLKNDGSGNFNESWDGIKDSTMNGYVFAEKFVEKANFELLNHKKMFRTPEGLDSVPVVPTKMQYVLMGTYFHRNDKFQNDDYFSGWEIADLFSVNPTSEINVFCIVPARRGSGIANGILSPEMENATLATKISFYDNYRLYPEWSIAYTASNMNHEIGHLLGLEHTWNQDDDCDDTPKGAKTEAGDWGQCWGYKEGDSYCGKWANLSNNIMDYNEHFPHAYTPCQINRIQIMLRTSAKKFVAQIGGVPPLHLFINALKEYDANNVTLDATASVNENAHSIEVIDLKKKPNFPSKFRRKIYSSGSIEMPIGQIKLSDKIKFKPKNYYLVKTKVQTKNGQEQKDEKVIYIK